MDDHAGIATPSEGGEARAGETGKLPVYESRRQSAIWVSVLLAAGLLVFFLERYVRAGYRFPIGPDAPVYLWWTRLASTDGLSAVSRPGIPAVTLVVGGALGLSAAQVLGGLGAALGAATGLAGAVLTGDARGPEDDGHTVSRATLFVVGGVLTGTFAVHLAGGYFANLAYAALFLCACSCLAQGSRRGSYAAAGLLGAAGLAHPLFFLVGGGILAVTAFLARRELREHPFLESESGRIAIAVAGGAAILGGGLLALLGGPGPLDVPTSQDAYLRRSGLGDALGGLYRDRFVRHVLRYLPFLTLPLALWGIQPERGFPGRLLRGWMGILLAGIAIGLITSWFPAERFLNFGYVIPIAVTLGLAKLLHALEQRVLALVAAVALVVALVAVAAFTWAQQHPFVDDGTAAKSTEAARVATGLPPGTPLVYASNAPGAGAGFAAAHDANLLRSAMPADRIRDVHIYVGSSDVVVTGQPTLTGDEVHDSMSRDSLTEIGALAGSPALLVPERQPAAAADTRPREHERERGSRVTATPANSGDGLGLEVATLDLDDAAAPSGEDPLAPHAPWSFVLAGVLTFLLLGVAGFGWAMVTTHDAARATALAPAFGLAVLILSAIVLERIGLPVDGWGAYPAILLAGGPGYVMLRVRKRAPIA